MKSQGEIFVVMEDDSERQEGEYGRYKWVTTITGIEAYTNFAEAQQAARKWQRNHDYDRNNGCSPDNNRRYYVCAVEIIK